MDNAACRSISRDPRLVPPLVIIIDGYEQLNRWNRFTLKRFCRRRQVGLLVTAHESAGFPQLYRTAATLDLAEQIVGRLMHGCEPPFTANEVSNCFLRHSGDMRETLFDLYDLYQRRR